MAKKFYKASNDSMFKAVFCNNKNKDLLEKLIEVAIERKVKIKKPLMQEILKPNIFVKNKTLDVLTEADGEKINIELNIGHYDGLNNRNASYIFSKYSEETKTSMNYKNMDNFIQINLTSGLPKEHKSVSIYKLIDIETKKEFIKNLTIYEFNLDKIKESCYNEGEEKYKILAALMCNKQELNKLCKGDKVLEKLESEVVRMNNDEKFTWFLTEEEDAEKVHNTLMLNAREEGYESGVEQNKLEIAKNMLAKKMDIEIISEITGLTKEEIKELQ